MNNQDEFEFAEISYVAIEADGCKTGAFHYRKNACRVRVATDIHVPPCRKEERKDNRSVVFVKKDVVNADHTPDAGNMVACPHCEKEYPDFIANSDFIGWHGICAECMLNGVEDE